MHPYQWQWGLTADGTKVAEEGNVVSGCRLWHEKSVDSKYEQTELLRHSREGPHICHDSKYEQTELLRHSRDARLPRFSVFNLRIGTETDAGMLPCQWLTGTL